MTHHQITGVRQVRQGIARQVTPAALLSLEIAIRLGRELGIPLAPALETATRLLGTEPGEAGPGLTTGALGLPTGGWPAGSSSIRIIADIDTIRRELDLRLERAVEISPSPRRGRPAHK